MIPKILHMTWVGDESKRPNRCIQSWIDHHPGWSIRLWGNAELRGRQWINQEHIEAMATREWNGVADLMRWEILFEVGGVLVDADSVCVGAIPEWILECEAFASWENELARPGLIAAGYIGTVPKSWFMAMVINEIKQKATVIDRMAWESVGPLHLTEVWRKYGYNNLTILPSHFFIPEHFSGLAYTGGGPVFAHQEWGSTLHKYDEPAGQADALTLRGAEDLKLPVPPEPAQESGHVFLYEPDWSGAEWAEVLLSYFGAFTPGEPVMLVFILDPAAIPLEQAERLVVDLMLQSGRERTADVVLLDQVQELLPFLHKYPRASWIPKGRGNVAGLEGHYGSRLAQVRRQMT